MLPSWRTWRAAGSSTTVAASRAATCSVRQVDVAQRLRLPKAVTSRNRLPRDFIKGAVCASGMYDLYPASLSARNLYLNFHLGDTMTALSPILHIHNIHFPVALGHGTKETPEFQRQSDDFAAALRAAGKDVTLIVAPGYNHFEFAETFANPYGALGRASLKLMGLQPGAALIWGQRPK